MKCDRDHVVYALFNGFICGGMSFYKWDGDLIDLAWPLLVSAYIAKWTWNNSAP